MKSTVIIIDDHKLFNDGLELILKESGEFIVSKQVYKAELSYHYCQELKPDLILVDYNMPVMNGLEVVKKLQLLPYQPKIVVISMYIDKKDIESFKTLGVNGYISKTVERSELISKLKLVLSGEYSFAKNLIQESDISDWFSIKTKLTKREKEIVTQVKLGLTTEKIAENLNLSFYTVETHRKNIYQKGKFKSKREYHQFLDWI
ncbi:response regulator [Jiulongibacter sp. NS-SX5]|uniref:response regulator n=1 Tax=Jiulongibacter sp. NS-SX5 TaxID=3463854 RepID=UPI004059A93A